MTPTELSREAQYVFRAGEYSTRDLRVVQIDGTEGFNQPFHYKLLIASRDREIKPEDVVGQAGVISILMNPNEPEPGQDEDPQIARYVNGIVRKVVHLMDGTGFSQYEFELVPFFWLLNHRRNSRIFQKKSTEDIVTKVLIDAGLTGEMFDFSLEGTYPKREYCVQYRESELDFVHRLLEEEGIFYFFEHSERKHVMKFRDNREAYPNIVANRQIPYHAPSDMVHKEHVYQIRVGEEIRSGKVTLLNQEFRTPVPRIEKFKEAEKFKELEFADYHSEYVVFDENKPEYEQDRKNDEQATRLSELRLGEFQSTRIFARGGAICRRMEPGRKFELTDHSRDSTNQEYVITQIHVRGRQQESTEEEAAAETADPRLNYDVDFFCIPATVRFVPQRVTPKPTIRGSQTAIVVGASGEEIYTDKYGRVKVHFAWDREGEFKETDSCWIRVSHSWAGGKYGIIHTPRVGQEVIVDFLEGDPDQPIITGRVYNGDHMPPYTLPDEKTKSTLRTNTSKGGGGANELRFEDMKGSEQIFLHAQKDLHIRALGHRKVNIKASAHETIGGEYRELVAGDRSRKVKKNEAIMVEGDRSLMIAGDVHQDYEGDQKKSVGKSYSIDAGMKVIIKAGMQISLVGPGGFVDIGPAGVTISGKMVLINSGGKAGSPDPAKVTAPAGPAAADTETPGQDVDYTGTRTPPVPVPLPELEEKSWIKITLKDEEGNPIRAEKFTIVTSDNEELTGRLDVNGEAYVSGIEPGECKIKFPERDQSEVRRG